MGSCPKICRNSVPDEDGFTRSFRLSPTGRRSWLSFRKIRSPRMWKERGSEEVEKET